MRDEHSIAMPQFQAVVSLTVFVALGNCYRKPLFLVSEEGTSAAMTKKFLAHMLESRIEQTKARPLRIILDGEYLKRLAPVFRPSHPSHSSYRSPQPPLSRA